MNHAHRHCWAVDLLAKKYKSHDLHDRKHKSHVLLIHIIIPQELVGRANIPWISFNICNFFKIFYFRFIHNSLMYAVTKSKLIILKSIYFLAYWSLGLVCFDSLHIYYILYIIFLSYHWISCKMITKLVLKRHTALVRNYITASKSGIRNLFSFLSPLNFSTHTHKNTLSLSNPAYIESINTPVFFSIQEIKPRSRQSW